MSEHLTESAADIAAEIPRYSWELMDEEQRDGLMEKVVLPNHGKVTSDGVTLTYGWFGDAIGANPEAVKSRILRLRAKKAEGEGASRAEPNSRLGRAATTLRQPGRAAEVLRDPEVRKAVTEAITSNEDVASSFATDPGFRGAMAKATGGIDTDSRERTRPTREPADDTAAWTRLAQRFARFRRDVQSDLDHVNPDHLSEDVRTILREEARRTIVACEMVTAALDTGDWDQALTHLVEGGQA